MLFTLVSPGCATCVRKDGNWKPTHIAPIFHFYIRTYINLHTSFTLPILGGNPYYLDVNFDFEKTARFFVGFLSLEILTSEIKILAYKPTTGKISIRNHTSVLIPLFSRKKIKYEETHFIKALEIYNFCATLLLYTTTLSNLEL